MNGSMRARKIVVELIYYSPHFDNILILLHSSLSQNSSLLAIKFF